MWKMFTKEKRFTWEGQTLEITMINELNEHWFTFNYIYNDNNGIFHIAICMYIIFIKYKISDSWFLSMIFLNVL